MGGCPFPEHHQSGGGGGAGRAALVLLAVVVAGAVAGPAMRVVTDLVEVAAVVVLALLAVAVAVAVVMWRVRRRRALAARPVVLTARQERPGLDRRRAVAAIEPPRADVSAYPRGHANTRVVTSRAARPRCPGRDGRRPS